MLAHLKKQLSASGEEIAAGFATFVAFDLLCLQDFIFCRVRKILASVCVLKILAFSSSKVLMYRFHPDMLAKMARVKSWDFIPAPQKS